MSLPTDEYLEVGVSWIATLLTFVMFAAPYRSLKRCYSTSSTHQLSSNTFVMMALSCSLWLTYAFLLGDRMMSFVNVVGAVLGFLYLGMYYVGTSMTKARNMIMQNVSIAVAFYAVIFWTLRNFDDWVGSGSAWNSLTLMGTICSTFTVLTTAAPLPLMVTIIKTKDASAVSMAHTIASGMCALSWFIYGLLVNDAYVALPNILSSLLAAVQTAIIIMYADKEKED